MVPGLILLSMIGIRVFVSQRLSGFSITIGTLQNPLLWLLHMVLGSQWRVWLMAPLEVFSSSFVVLKGIFLHNVPQEMLNGHQPTWKHPTSTHNMCKWSHNGLFCHFLGYHCARPHCRNNAHLLRFLVSESVVLWTGIPKVGGSTPSGLRLWLR